MDWIGETVRSEYGWHVLETLADIDSRMAGTPGEAQAAEVVAEAFGEVGARNIQTVSFPIQGWERINSRIEAAGRQYPSIGLPRSPAGAVSGELVDLGYGLPADFEADLSGAIVIARSDVPDYYERYVHRREKYYRAVEAGAAGFIYQNHVDGNLPPTGSVGNEDHVIAPIPAFGVGAETGEALVRKHEGEVVDLAVSAAIDSAASQNVYATIGPETDERVLVTAHLDAHDIGEGAIDNGAGVATVVEIGRALASRSDDLDLGVDLVAFGAEEVGLHGSIWDVGERDMDTVRAVLNCDAVIAGRTLQLYTNGFETIGSVLRSVADEFGHPVDIVPRIMPHSDHWPYVIEGVPGAMATSTRAGTGRGFGHTSADTLDKVDKRNLSEQVLLLTELTTRLAQATCEIPRRDADSIAADLEAQNTAPGMKITGDWPFDEEPTQDQ